MVRNLSFLFAAFTAVPVLALAQAPSAAAPAIANPISRSQAKMYSLLSNVVIAGAEKMPEENYSFKPSPDVRNFGQLVGHLADSQYFFCSSVIGDKNAGPAAEKSKTSKAELISALKEGVAYCNKTYATMTDANGSEMTLEPIHPYQLGTVSRASASELKRERRLDTLLSGPSLCGFLRL